MKIILDNGHGVDTPGKRSPKWADGRQLLEYKFNREVVAIIHSGLLRYGFKPHILVPEEHDISLDERVHRVNQIYDQDRMSFGVSIHGNAFTGRPTAANGWEVWTSHGETESDILAEYLYIESRFLPFKARRDTRDGDSDKESRFAMVHRTRCPFVLTENGFMDNLKDCKYMMSQTGKYNIAWAHINAIAKFIVSGRGIL